MNKSKSILIIFCLFAFVSIILISYYVFRFFQFSGDEYSYVFQSKIFKSGRLYSNSPQIPEFFELHHVINDGRWYSKYPFGWPLIMSLGEAFNLRWIVNPLIGVIAIVVLFYFTEFILNKEIAHISIFLMVTSPFFIFNSSSYFPHPSSLLFSLAFLFFYLLSLKKQGRLYPIAVGFSGAVLFFIRPIDFLVISIPIAIYSLIALYHDNSLLKALVTMLSVFLILSSIPLYINYVLTGNPLKFAYSVYNPNDRLGFVYGNGLMSGIQNTTHHFAFLLIWLPFAVLIPFAKYNKINWLLLSIFIVNVLAYFFYFSPGGDQFGPRYYYISLPSMLILASSAINRLKTNKKWILSLLLLLNLALNIYFAWDIHREVLFRRQVYDFVVEQDTHNSIILLKSTKEQGCAWYTRNSPTLDDDNLFVCDLGYIKNKELIKAFPNRKIHFYDLKVMGQSTSDYHKTLVW